MIGDTVVGQVALANAERDYTTGDLDVVVRLASLYAMAVQRDRAVAPVAPEAWALYWMKRFSPRLLGWIAAKGSQRGLAEIQTLSESKSASERQ